MNLEGPKEIDADPVVVEEVKKLDNMGGKRAGSGRKKLERTPVRLIDHELRHQLNSQGIVMKYIDHSLFPTEESRIEEKARLQNIQREKNLNYKIMSRGYVVTGTIPKERAYPDVVYSDEVNLELDAGTGNTLLLVASSKAGKTTMMMEIYRKYYEDSLSIMFAHNSQLGNYKEKNLVVADEYLPRLVDVMRRVAKINKNKFDFLCMFDDMLKVKDDSNVTDLFLSLRNSNISSIISLQYINLMSKACRGNVNNILAGAHNSDENILVLIKCYLMSWMKKMGVTGEADMVLFYRRLTMNHGFILIHPSSGDVRFVRLKI